MNEPRKPGLYPPAYLALHALVMVGLHFFFPLARWIPSPIHYLGAVPVLLGLALVLNGASLFRRHETTIKPFEESSALVITGPYRLSRNPIYLGMAVSLAGIAVLLGSATPWIAVLVFVWLISALFIRQEEAMLENHFGAQYLEYKARVRRWI